MADAHDACFPSGELHVLAARGAADAHDVGPKAAECHP